MDFVGRAVIAVAGLYEEGRDEYEQESELM